MLDLMTTLLKDAGFALGGAFCGVVVAAYRLRGAGSTWVALKAVVRRPEGPEAPI